MPGVPRLDGLGRSRAARRRRGTRLRGRAHEAVRRRRLPRRGPATPFRLTGYPWAEAPLTEARADDRSAERPDDELPAHADAFLRAQPAVVREEDDRHARAGTAAVPLHLRRFRRTHD